MKKVTVATNAQGEDVINVVGTYLQITFDTENVVITEKAEITGGLEEAITIQKPMIQLPGFGESPENTQLTDLTSGFVNSVFALYSDYRKAISPILKAQNPDNF